MFDPHLTREKALREIGQDENTATLNVEMSQKLISSVRTFNQMRYRCFASKENYQQHSKEFNELVEDFRRAFAQSVPFQFLDDKIRLYMSGGQLQRQHIIDVYKSSSSLLDESMANAMNQSEQVHVSISITQQGVLLDVNQGEKTFDKEFLDDLRKKALDVYRKLASGTPINKLLLELRTSLRKVIGYVPKGLEPTNGLPFRGNGLGNILINPYFRTGYVSEGQENHTISVHSAAQLPAIEKFNTGNKDAIRTLYDPRNDTKNTSASDAPDTRVIDEVFGGGFDFPAGFK